MKREKGMDLLSETMRMMDELGVLDDIAYDILKSIISNDSSLNESIEFYTTHIDRSEEMIRIIERNLQLILTNPWVIYSMDFQYDVGLLPEKVIDKADELLMDISEENEYRRHQAIHYKSNVLDKYVKC